MSLDAIPAEAVGLRLLRWRGDRLFTGERIRFSRGRPAVLTTLRRAMVSGRVEVDGPIQDHAVDVLDADGSMIETVALDAKSYRSLKTRWMRCRLEEAD